MQFEKNMLSDWETLDAHASRLQKSGFFRAAAGLSAVWAKVIELHKEGYRCRMTEVEVATCWRE